jgi:hypothetical protein
MRFEPEVPGDRHRIDRTLAPPFGLFSITVKLAMVAAAQRHSELIADLAAKRSGLRKPQVMGVARLAAADQAGLLRHMAHVVAIADSARLGERQEALVDRQRSS